MEEHPVRLVHVDLSHGIGLAERTLWELATRLPRERYAVRVWLSAAGSADGLAEALEARGFGVERIDEPGSRWDPRTPFRLWLKLRRERPQLVHVHHAGEPASLRVARAAAADGVPVLITRHDLGASDADVAATPPEIRRVYQRADLIVTASRGTRERLARTFGIPRDQVRCISYGTEAVDEELDPGLARAWRVHLGVRPLRPLWVCPLRLDRERGHEVLLDALAELKRRELDFMLAFLADGPLRPELERRAEAAGIDRQVCFIEVVPGLDSLLAAADAVVFPMLEGPLPLTLLDAMGRGRPVAASAIEVIADIVEDGVNGRLVPAGDPLALADVLESLHRRPDAALKLGRAAAERVRDGFTWDRVIDAYEDAYDEALGLASFAPERTTR